MESLDTFVAGCHREMVAQGFWDEAQSSTPLGDAEQLALLGDLVVAVGSLINTQRKEGKIAPAGLDAAAQAVGLLRQLANRGTLPPYARIGARGYREQETIVPATGLDGHILRQFLHLVAEVRESIETLRAADYRMAAIDVEEVADIGLVYVDLAAAWGERVVDALHAKRVRNRTRGQRFGRVMKVINVGPERETIFFGQLPISPDETRESDTWTLETLVSDPSFAVK